MASTPTPTRRTLRPRAAPSPSSSTPTPTRLILHPPRRRSILKPFEPPLVSSTPPDSATYSNTTIFTNTIRNSPMMPAAPPPDAPLSSRAARAAVRAARGSPAAWRAQRLAALQRDDTLRWLEELNEGLIMDDEVEAEADAGKAGEAGEEKEKSDKEAEKSEKKKEEKGGKGGEGDGEAKEEEGQSVGFAEPLNLIRPFLYQDPAMVRVGMDYLSDSVAGDEVEESSESSPSDDSGDDLTDWWKEEDREMMEREEEDDNEDEEVLADGLDHGMDEDADRDSDDVVPMDISPMPSPPLAPAPPPAHEEPRAPDPVNDWLATLQAARVLMEQAEHERMWQEAYAEAEAREHEQEQENARALEEARAQEEADRQGTPPSEFFASICHVFTPSFDSPSAPSLDYDKRADEQAQGQNLTLEPQLDLPSGGGGSADRAFVPQQDHSAGASDHLNPYIAGVDPLNPNFAAMNPLIPGMRISDAILYAEDDELFRAIPAGPVGEWDRFMAYEFSQAESVEDMVRGGGLWGLKQMRVDLGVDAVDEMLGRSYGSFVGLDEVQTGAGLLPELEPLPDNLEEANAGEDVDMDGEDI